VKALVGIAAAVVSIGAGIYLLTSQSASEETTVFDALMHGIGAYFIARGLWMFSRLDLRTTPTMPGQGREQWSLTSLPEQREREG
jgi:hypothetical protein